MKKQQLNMSAVGKIYIVCALLQNTHTCLYGNIISSYFDCEPPSLEQYFGTIKGTFIKYLKPLLANLFYKA